MPTHAGTGRERNIAWLPRLEVSLQGAGTVVAVGAAHLCGPTGLPDPLRARSCKIERLAIPAKP